MKKVFAVMLFIAILFSLAACRGTVDPVTEPTNAPTSAPTAAPTAEPTTEPYGRPELVEYPMPLDLGSLSPLFSIPVVEYDIYDAERDRERVVMRGEYADNGYLLNAEGPADYDVSDGKLMVLDVFAGLIRVFDIETREWVRNIDVSEVGLDPETNRGRLAYYDGRYFVYSSKSGAVVSFGEDGSVSERMNVPAGKGGRLMVLGGRLYLVASGIGKPRTNDYLYSDGGFTACDPVLRSQSSEETVVIEGFGFTWTIEKLDDQDEITLLGVDENGDLYLRYSAKFWDADFEEHIEEYLLVYDKESRLVAANDYGEKEGFVIFVDTEIRMKDTETAYLLIGTARDIRLYEIPFMADESQWW
ncbi:MAG: PT domain-containing protein [Clostridiales bacterium]|nr:PT domain-containing protein [Clostridiales bacterium]